MLQDTKKQGNETPKLFWEAMFISMLAETQKIHIQRLRPEKKGVLPYIPFQAKYRSEGKKA
jgi:hypothetical protein